MVSCPRPYVRARASPCGLALAMFGLGCVQGPGRDGSLPSADYEQFATTVQPILDERCGERNCHGTLARPLWVYSPKGLRMRASPGPLTNEELEANYWCARSFLLNAESADNAPLLTKPLDVEEGGLEHATGPVFENQNEHGYVALHAWAAAALGERR